MYKLLLLIIMNCIAWSFSPSLHGSFYAQPTTKVTFLGSICTPQHCKSTIPYIAYYKGSKIEAPQGIFSIKERPDHQEFYFIFTLDPIYPESTTKEDANTIKHFKMPKSNNYLCFRMSKNPVYWNALFAPNFARKVGIEKAKDAWNIERLKLNHLNDGTMIHLPEQTVIVLIDPTFIKDLEQESWDCEMNTIKMPKIVLKESLSHNNLEDMHVNALFAACDIDPFHRKPTLTKESHPDNTHVVLSMVAD